MIHVPDEIQALREKGYICLSMRPLMWKVRGPYGTVEIYPYSSQYRRHTGILQTYSKLEQVVEGIEPYETPSAEMLGHIKVWREGLDKVLAVIHKRIIASGKKTGKMS